MDTVAQPDVLIIGGGVIGASIAYYLSEQGASVTLVERGRAGGHASLAAAGMLHPIVSAGTPDALRALTAASFALFPDLVARLRELTGIDAEYQEHGWIAPSFSADEARTAAADELTEAAAGYGLYTISGDEAHAMEPALSPAAVSAIVMPRGADVYAPALLQAYTHAAARLGATIRRGVEVVEFCMERRRVIGARTADGERIDAGHTVVAGGAWSARTAAALGVDVAVYPLRGQILALHAIPTPLCRTVHGHEVSLVPKADGSLVVGATVEKAGFDDRLTAAGVQWLLDAAQRLVPSAANLTFRQAWTGLRPASPDTLPLLGPIGDWEGVSIATGHTREGILLSPITGRLMAQHVRGEPTDLSLQPFRADRFAPAGSE